MKFLAQTSAPGWEAIYLDPVTRRTHGRAVAAFQTWDIGEDDYRVETSALVSDGSNTLCPADMLDHFVGLLGPGEDVRLVLKDELARALAELPPAKRDDSKLPPPARPMFASKEL